jgi:hypothetical protein
LRTLDGLRTDGGTMIAPSHADVRTGTGETVGQAAPESEERVANRTIRAKREEIMAVLALLRAEEEDHLARLRSLMCGSGQDRPVMAKGLRFNRA